MQTALATAEELRRAGRYNEGIRVVAEILRQCPGEAAAHYRLGNLYIDQGDLERAEQVYLRALELDPDHAGALNNLAVVYRRQKRTRLFVKTYKKARRAAVRASEARDRAPISAVAVRRFALRLVLILLVAGLAAFAIWMIARG